MRVCRVAPDVPALSGRTFDYLVPAEFAEACTVGTIVRVALHGRRVRGWVLEDGVEPETAPEKLKPLLAVVSGGPPAEVVALCEWTAWRFAGPLLPLLRAASPAAIVPPRPGTALRPPAPESLRPISPQAADLAARAVAHPMSIVRWPPATPVGGLVRALLPAEGSAIVILPGAADRLAERLREDVASVVHLAGEGRDRDRARAWDLARQGSVVVVGGRSAVFAPVPDLAAVIVLDEADESLRETRAPSWSAREVAAERTLRTDARLVFVTPAPTLEALCLDAAAAVPPAGQPVLVRPPTAAERTGWPVTEVVDRRPDPPGAGLFSARFVSAVHQTLDLGGRVVCVLNRKGRARLLACGACGELVRCDRCGAALREAPDLPSTLECTHCHQTRPRVCDHCMSTRLKVIRAGVTKVAGELGALISRAPVALVEAGSDDIPAEPLLIGTEAVLHRIRRAGLVAFLDFDQELAAPRVRAAEQALWMLVRAARIVGGRQTGGRVLVQTRVPTHEVLRAATLGDPTLVSEAEENRRRPLHLPPFGALARLDGEPDDLAVAAGILRVHGVEVATGAPVLVRAATHEALADALAAARAEVRLSVEVDPLRL